MEPAPWRLPIAGNAVRRIGPRNNATAMAVMDSRDTTDRCAVTPHLDIVTPILRILWHEPGGVNGVAALTPPTAWM